MKKKKTRYIVGALLVILVLFIVLKKAGVIGAKKAVEVAVDKASYHDIIQTVSASGKIYPEVVVSVSSDVSGEIVDLPVVEGDSVTQGQVVAKIYADVYNSIRDRSEASVNQSQAQLSNAHAALAGYKASLDMQKASFDRNQKLYNLKVISRQEFEQSQSAYEQALSSYNAAEQQIKSSSFALKASQADLQQAVDNLHRTTIGAPMSGYVTYLPVKKGERVVGTAQMSGTEIMRVADMDTMEVQVDVGENDVPKVFIGDTALIEVDAYTGRKFKGIVTQIASSSQDLASQTTATGSSSSASQVTNYTVHIRILENSYKDLLDPAHREHFPFRPGMSANVDIQTKRHMHVLSVPIAAVTAAPDQAPPSTAAEKPGAVPKADTSKAPSTDSVATPKSGEIVYMTQADGTVTPVAVATSIQDENYIEITSGLKEGDQVVSAPYTAITQELHKGTRVKIVPKAQLFKPKK